MKLIRHLCSKWADRINLRKRIALTMILLIAIITVFLGMTIFHISKDTIEKNYQKAHVHNLQVSGKMMDIYLENIVEECRSLLEDKQFINIMNTETSSGSYFSSRNQLSLDKTMGEIITLNSMINGMLVLNNNGNWRYYAKNKVYSGYLNHFYTTDNLLDQDWIQISLDAKGKEVFYPYDVILGDKAQNCFCYVKNLISPYNQKSFGYLVVSIDKNIWEETFGNDTEGFETNRYMVVLPQQSRERSEVVYFKGMEEEKQQIIDAYNSGDNSTYLFSSYSNNTTNWTFLNVITKQELESDSDNIRKILITVILVMIFVSISAAAMISSYITKPLDVLAGSMSEVEAGIMKVETVFDNSEVGKIGNRFKSLVNNNLELRERLLNLEIKEKDAQLLLLQSQINPHFLYNTLDALYFMALIEQADDIADMVQALSNMFRLSLNKGDKLIALRDEIDRMRDYMKIQNFRFHDRFTLHVDVDENDMDIKILTFLLQPILENAVYHGLESQIGPGNIYLKAKRTGQNLHISIRDDGIGIEDLRLLEKGYGIKNIKERIRLHYGIEDSLTIRSEKNAGTIVEMIISCDKEEISALNADTQ